MPPDRNAYPRSGHVFVALVLSIALWAVMVFWSLAYLRRIAGGLEPFDLRPFGYDIGEARALLAALSQLGRDYYLNTQLSLDNAFPATYALSRVLLLLWLTIPGRLADHPIPLLARLALLVLPVATAAYDYVENDAHGRTPGRGRACQLGEFLDAGEIARCPRHRRHVGDHAGGRV